MTELDARPEDDVSQYLQEIRQIPRLTPQEERDLAQGCARGDQEAIRRLVTANLRLVVFVAREYAGRGVPLLDLIQEGSIGLLAAAKKYDYTLDYRFSTYATKWIRQGVTRCLMNHKGLIRVPQHTMERMRKVLSTREALRQETGTEPTLEEISRRSGFSPEKVMDCLRLNPETCSLDAAVGEDEDTLGSLLENLEAPQPQEEVVRQEMKAVMDSLLSRLTPRQREVLSLRFGMEDGTCYSLEAVGKKLGVSKERARQLEGQAMAKLKKLGAGLGLEDFLDE